MLIRFLLTIILVLFSPLREICHAQWILQNPLPQGNQSRLVLFVDTNLGWAVGESGTILKTTDGGQNSITQTSRTTYTLQNVTFSYANTGWVVGNYGTILKTMNGGATFIKEDDQSEISNTYTLQQNYPNPFNPSTKIKYTIPMDNGELTMDNVSLKVFDILGREVATLVNEEQAPGSYEVDFSVARISNPRLVSGVYFYQLRAGTDVVITRKMIILK